MKHGNVKIAKELSNEGIELEIKRTSSLTKIEPLYMPVTEHFSSNEYAKVLEEELGTINTRKYDREEYTSQMANAITSGKRLFKGAVTDDVVAFYETICNKVAEIKMPNPIDLFKVVEVEIPPILVEGQESFNLEGLVGARLSTINFSGVVNVEPKLETMLTGSGDLDAEIEEAFLLKGIHQETWDMFFGNKLSTPSINRSFESVDDFTLMDRLIPVFLTYDRLVRDTAFEGVTTNMDNTSYRVSVINIRKWLGTKIMGAKTRVHAAVDNNVLVHLTNNNENFILVDKKVYGDFLDNGGSVELLLGRLVHDDGMRTLEEISRNITKYVGAWKTFTAMSTRSRNEGLLEHDRKIILEALDANIVRKFPPYKDKGTQGKLVAEAAVLKIVKDLKVGWRENMQGFCLEAICNTFYPNSYAYTYLSNAEKVAHANPEMAAEDVDFIVTVEYLTLYLSSQLQIKAN